ncbi:MAG TPA: Flp pilus assembly protein CpaB, partial [Candidatus Binatia bacterium]|nr:Flp pilus assembly protein CpaB [Candidatus Binatia bacterium]
MNNIRKLLIGVVVALVVAGAFTAIVYKKIQTGKVDAIKQTRTWKYVATTRDVAAGERVTADMITMVDWSSNLPVEGALDSADKAIGHVVSFPVSGGMVLTEKMLAASDSALGLPNKIPDGMRAIAIQTDQVADFNGFLFPGAHVDVLMTTKSTPGGAPSPMGASVAVERDRTIVILENVSVLATGKQMVPDPQGKPTEVSVVTLLVTPDDARKVALAQQKGVVHLALRNSADLGAATRKATYLNDLDGAPQSQVRTGASTSTRHSASHSDEEGALQKLHVQLGTRSFIQTYRNNVQVGD